MTEQARQAGETAFMIGISFGDNPYTTPEARQAWETGHKAGRRRYLSTKHLLFPALYYQILPKGER